MKAAKKGNGGRPTMDGGWWRTSVGRIVLSFILMLFIQAAYGQRLSEGKNLRQLEDAVFSAKSIRFSAPVSLRPRLSSPIPNPPSQIPSHPFLPRWSAECLPFFCRIEHDVAKKSAVPVKFRLGSVEYVDWLEGKGNAAMPGY